MTAEHFSVSQPTMWCMSTGCAIAIFDQWSFTVGVTCYGATDRKGTSEEYEKCCHGRAVLEHRTCRRTALRPEFFFMVWRLTRINMPYRQNRQGVFQEFFSLMIFEPKNRGTALRRNMFEAVENDL